MASQVSMVHDTDYNFNGSRTRPLKMPFLMFDPISPPTSSFDPSIISLTASDEVLHIFTF